MLVHNPRQRSTAAPRFQQAEGVNPATLLRAIRRDQKLSQRELAELVGVPRSTVDRIESERMQRPGFVLIERILEASGYHLRVMDTWGEELDPVEHWEGTWDRGGRRFPAHLQLLPVHDMDNRYWWGWFRIAFQDHADTVPEWTYFHRPKEIGYDWDTYHANPDTRWNDAT
jgi:transcriptional regulator with XRE-family HTH domain